MLFSRYLEPPIAEDLPSKMVFMAGPRQVGKTTLARQIIARTGSGLYLSWDRREDRRTLREGAWPSGPRLIVLDELHKLRGWKRWLKGEFDRHREEHSFLVTGSARLDVYRRGGDSLQGRYHHYRLHPFTLAELDPPPEPPEAPGQPLRFRSGSADTLAQLLRHGGFPEPFLAASDRVLRRWHQERMDRFFQEDVRDLESVRDLSALEQLAELATQRAGALLSINALREELEVSHRTASSWIDLLERLYFLFRITPFETRVARATRKMPKVYLWDWSGLADDGARFENLVASHLLKLCHSLEDREGHRMKLHYLRDKDGREVDFLVTANRKPWFAVEAKVAETRLDPSLRYFVERLQVPYAYQVVLRSDRDFEKDGIRCLPARVFLSALV